jgi:hypothetical protein
MFGISIGFTSMRVISNIGVGSTIGGGCANGA